MRLPTTVVPIKMSARKHGPNIFNVKFSRKLRAMPVQLGEKTARMSVEYPKGLIASANVGGVTMSQALIVESVCTYISITVRTAII